MPSPRFPIPQGTLDMLILQILSLEDAHGYGIAQRLEQISRSVVSTGLLQVLPVRGCVANTVFSSFCVLIKLL